MISLCHSVFFSYIFKCGIFFFFFSVLVDSTASVCFLVFNLCRAANCPSHNSSDAATEGDPDYTTLLANAKSPCLMAAAQKLCVIAIHMQQTQIKQPPRATQILILNMFKSCCFSCTQSSLNSWGRLASLACIYSQPSDTIIKETHCGFHYFCMLLFMWKFAENIFFFFSL